MGTRLLFHFVVGDENEKICEKNARKNEEGENKIKIPRGMGKYEIIVPC